MLLARPLIYNLGGSQTNGSSDNTFASAADMTGFFRLALSMDYR